MTAPLETLIVLAATALALWFRPWASLRAGALLTPWLAALVLLPWLWSLQGLLPGGLALQLSGACLMVLMFGWPLAVLTLLPVSAAGAWLAGAGWAQAIELAAWNGVVPATFALALGMATRRWLPAHLFVYILARGFIGTALATFAAGALQVAWQAPPAGSEADLLVVGHWLMAWGEAFMTGMFTAIFVALRPEWLLTYSDRRYLPRG